MLTDKEAEARTVFGRIEDRGPYTKNGADAQVADFLVKLAHLLRGADPVPGSVSKDYDKWSYQGIAFLALALKDWNLDKFDDATALFRQFNDVSPDKLVEWADGPEDLRKLKDIADNFVNDYKEYMPAKQALDAVEGKPIEEQRDAVEAAQAARKNMKLTTKLSKSLDDTLIVISGPRSPPRWTKRPNPTAEELAADDKAADRRQEKARRPAGQVRV